MRGAFVVRLGPGTKPTHGLLEGWVEEVDSGKEARFHSSAELVKFLGESFCRAFSVTEPGSGDRSETDT